MNVDKAGRDARIIRHIRQIFDVIKDGINALNDKRSFIDLFEDTGRIHVGYNIHYCYLQVLTYFTPIGLPIWLH